MKRLVEVLRVEHEHCLMYVVPCMVGADLDDYNRSSARSTGRED